jgi:hypothetical protein
VYKGMQDILDLDSEGLFDGRARGLSGHLGHPRDPLQQNLNFSRRSP